MNRRRFLQSGVALGSLAPFTHPFSTAGASSPQTTPTAITSRFVGSGNIRDYLSSEAAQITRRAVTDLPSAEQWQHELPARRAQWREMLGLDTWWTEHRDPPPVTVTGVIEREYYRVEKLYYESWPGLPVTANLYLPKRRQGRVPGVLYVCGHSRNQKVAYQAQGRRFAELGFACLVVETIQLGEIEGFHHGCYREGWWHWYSRGYSPAGIETLNGIRGLDLLAHRPEVDPERLGVTGISGGGATSWWVAAADERVRAAAPVCGTATVFSHVHDRTIDGHCDCMWWTNTYRWDLADVGALVAPRALMIASADKDGIFTIESIRQIHQQVARIYQKLEAPQNLRLVETPGGHSYHERSRTEIFSWFARHLQGKEIPATTIGDLDARPESQETLEKLKVFVNGIPAGARTATIQDDFFVPPVLPELADATALAKHRRRVTEALRQKTFGAFPKDPPALDTQIEYEFDEDAAGYRFGFTSEPGWRLHAQCLHRKPLPQPAAALIGLRLPGEGRWDTRSFLLRLKEPWARVALDVRGVGDTAWGEDLNWHLRRASAWTGRTIASMRVWDTLRGIEAVRQLPGIDPDRICLAGRGEMAAVVLYAALLDGRIRTVFLENPPSTQNAPGEKDGRGPALEMLNCLRITDLTQVATLLWPTELVLLGPTPAPYDAVEAVHQRLGTPGRVVRLRDIAEWNPA